MNAKEEHRLHKYYVSLGSNTDLRDTIVENAIARICDTFGNVRSSGIYHTPCWRGLGAEYANAVVCFESENTLDSLEVLFKNWEKDQGRTPEDSALHIVALDIDVVLYDDKVIRPRDMRRKYFLQGFYSIFKPGSLKISNYFYELPNQRIAKHPLEQRDHCRLLVCSNHGIVADTTFNKVGTYLPSPSLLVYNNTRVINARIEFVKDTGARIEIFCLEPIEPNDYQLNFSSTRAVIWKCLVGNSKRWASGLLSKTFTINGKEITLKAERKEKQGADSLIQFSWNDPHLSFSDIISAAGKIPIPPYLLRDTQECDSTDYQTVFSRIEGSVAAPTAGLHFTDSLLDELSETGISRREVTLHVGAGTFSPVKSESMEGHDMHSELIDVSRSLIAELSSSDRPITAVGTTTVRTLESLYHIGCLMAEEKWEGHLDQWYPYNPQHPRIAVKDALSAILSHLDENGQDRLITATRIIIAPGYQYQIVDNLITNFHQPGSTLLLLVAAIVGDKWREFYDYALEHDYRFLSYGDACLFLNLKHL